MLQALFQGREMKKLYKSKEMFIFHILGCCFSKNYFFIATQQGGFIVPYVWEIQIKNLTNFEGCHFPQFCIRIWSYFRKIETNNFNSSSSFFNLVKPATISPAAHFLNCVHIGRGQTMAATICGLSKQKVLNEYF